MADLTLALADQIIDGALDKARELGCEALCVAVLDRGGHLKALRRQDGASLFRPDVAIGKAWGAVALGQSSRELAQKASKNPSFLQALSVASGGRLLPQVGGVLIKNGAGEIIGSVGISGDVGDRDEQCAIAGIQATGLRSDPDPA